MIHKALIALRPGAQWTLNGDTYNGIDWLDEVQTKPTEEEVDAEVARIQGQIPLDKCKAEAQKRLSASDWSVLPDVNISNKSDFEAYRATLRGLIANPVANPEYPIEPTPIWV